MMTTRADKGGVWASGNAANDYLHSSSARIAQNLQQRTGLSEIEWASAWLPVLAIEQGLDLKQNVRAGIQTRTVKRTDLAARLGIDADKPLGRQLVSQGKLSYEEGRLVDGDLFKNRLLELKLRFYGTVCSDSRFIDSLNSAGLIESVEEDEDETGPQEFVTIKTKKFLDLAKLLASKCPGDVVLLSINDSVLYI